ncbi:ArsR/SmtB family transcription factor [Dictyobacter kobayashii]|uniref:HTH arsR-type domain-containing protein n=1 Tax=Dictyobacter kobayashii TaxID=2014872 RepID=A0A402AYG3_9CHLR|nr:metalloregulator ArsR/SmtB family transcription factor [Dictyobacter kobayashii]GCE24128.1 hypothetical protein KDK_79280 [Dictyobacter kobayashii]
MNPSIAAVQAPELFKLLSHDIRWQIVTLLARSDYYGQELVKILKQPQNLISYHLKQLTGSHLVHERRNDVDERSIYYSLDIEMLRTLYLASGTALHLDADVAPLAGPREVGGVRYASCSSAPITVPAPKWLKRFYAS